MTNRKTWKQEWAELESTPWFNYCLETMQKDCADRSNIKDAVEDRLRAKFPKAKFEVI